MAETDREDGLAGDPAVGDDADEVLGRETRSSLGN